MNVSLWQAFIYTQVRPGYPDVLFNRRTHKAASASAIFLPAGTVFAHPDVYSRRLPAAAGTAVQYMEQ